MKDQIGLFGLARYINHTGHILQEVAVAIATRSLVWGAMVVFIIQFICFQLTPETEVHMKKKYGEKFEQYVKLTPYKFVPGVW